MYPIYDFAHSLFLSLSLQRASYVEDEGEEEYAHNIRTKLKLWSLMKSQIFPYKLESEREEKRHSIHFVTHIMYARVNL